MRPSRREPVLESVRKNLLRVAAIMVLVVAVASAALVLFTRTSNEASERESLGHVSESSAQLAYNLSNSIDATWYNVDYAVTALSLADTSSTEALGNFLALINDEVDDPSDYYLISRDGAYVEGGGQTGVWYFSQGMSGLIATGAPTTTMRRTTDGDQILLMKTIDPFTCDGHEYSYIAAEFPVETYLQSLELMAYDGEGLIVVIDSTGEVLFSTGNSDTYPSNTMFFETLANAEFTYAGGISNKSELYAAFSTREPQKVKVTISDVDYALSITPVEGYDWSVALIVDYRDIEDARMQNLTQMRGIAIAMLAGSAALIYAVYALHTVRANRRAQEKLRERDNLLDIICSDTSNAYLLLDEDTLVVRYASVGLKSMFDIEPAKLMGREVGEGVRGEVQERHPELLTSTFETNDTDDAGGRDTRDGEALLAYGEFVRTSLDGWDREEKLVTPRYTYLDPVRSEQRYFHGECLQPSDGQLVFSLVDETEAARREDALTSAMRSAEVANRAKTDFLSSMSHDLRTPLNAIMGFAMLQEHNPDDAAAVTEYAHKIGISARLLLDLINGILDMNKIESGHTTLHLQEFHLGDLLDEVNTLIRPTAEAKSQEFKIRANDIFAEHLVGDPMRLKQIMNNLLSNAVKYTPEGGHIRMEVTGTGSMENEYELLTIIVNDDGVGMSEEFQQTIFEPFSREADSRVTEIQGTGLGMTITKNLVNLMGGTIGVQSAKGEGTTFHVELELRRADLALDHDFWERRGIGRMLVIDDDPDVCAMIVKLMEPSGVIVEEAHGGIDGVQMALDAEKSGSMYDAILVDWKMPDLDGVEVTRRIREGIVEAVPIIVLTAYDWTDIEAEARAAGVDAFVSKPFFVATFQNAIEQIEHRIEAEHLEADHADLTGLHLLLVEDNALNIEILKEIVSMKGATYETAQNGEEAVEKFEAASSGHFSAILMDIQMPKMNGYEATRAIRASSHADAASIPIIAMTANAFQEDVRMAIEAGMDAHLAKPVDVDKLVATLAHYTRG